jgi:hypothetical protein
MTLKYFLPFILCILFIAGCARQTSPTGGPKDTIPPKLISTNPKNEQINFNGRQIDLEFNEALNLNAAKEQVIITPSIGKEYEITTKKNSVTIDLNATLNPNTTYTINFREAIQDITERNPVRNLKLAFSTGSYLDSLSLEGKATDLITKKELKDITVALQVINDTMSILDDPALYFTRSDEKGNFKLDYIKPGLYQLYAFQDKNKNLIVDSRNEAYAFIASPINLKQDTAKLQLQTVRLDTRQLKVTSARPFGTYFNIKTNKFLLNHTITSPDQEDLSYYYGEDKANIRLYNTFQHLDSLRIQFTASDSSGSRIDTVLYAKFRKGEKLQKEKFTMTIEQAKITARTGNIAIRYKFNKPVASFNLDSIYFKKDTTTNINFIVKDVNWDQANNTFTINKTVDKKTFLLEEQTDDAPSKSKDTTKTIRPVNELLTLKGAFISIEGDSSASLKQRIEVDQPSSLSEIIYEVTTKRPNVLVQLLTRDFRLVAQTSKLKGSFIDIPAGDYIIRYLIDENANNAWDPGNYLEKREPEKVFYSKNSKGEIIHSVKANWELELAPMLISD